MDLSGEVQVACRGSDTTADVRAGPLQHAAKLKSRLVYPVIADAVGKATFLAGGRYRRRRIV